MTDMLLYFKLPPVYFLLLIAFLTCEGQSTAGASPDLIPVAVGVPHSEGKTVIAIPPATSWSGTISFAKANGENAQPRDVLDWVKQQNGLNGLEGISTPWHIVISYDQFDADGDNIHSGVFEELWDGPKKYVVSYKADDLKQTDYATDHGLYRLGDQKWPNRAQMQVSGEVMSPFKYATTLHGVSIRSAPQTLGSHPFNCAFIENGPGRMVSPAQYCFEPSTSQLRYDRGGGWYQTTYNDLVSFNGRFVGKTVDVYDAGKPYLKLHVDLLEPVTNKTDPDFAPPVDAINLSGQTLTGVTPVPLSQIPPEWPDSLRQEHFSVNVEILIGKDGHVKTAHAISGPKNAFKAAEGTARKWVFQPYMVLDDPAEVTTTVILNNN